VSKCFGVRLGCQVSQGSMLRLRKRVVRHRWGTVQRCPEPLTLRRLESIILFAQAWAICEGADGEETMDLQQLHERTGIERRKLRYCLDHDLVPELYIKETPNEAGRPRKFAEDVGFGLTCAAELLALGLPHDRIRGFLGGLLSIRLDGKGGGKQALVAVLERRGSALAQLGDGVNVRITVEEYQYDSGWLIPGNPAKLDRSYRPTVIVTLDLGQIREKVFRGN